jgi:phospholipase C
MWERLEQRRIARRRLRPGPAERPRPDLPTGSDLIPQIKHIVILMMQGHSYDNYLGMMQGRGDGLPLGPDGAPDVVNSVQDGRQFHAHHLTSTRQIAGEPTDTRQACNIQFGTGEESDSGGFAASVVKTVPGGSPAMPLGYWTEDDLPFCYSLARVFPVADRWFSSFLGPAYPNRRFLVAGTANGLSDDRRWNPDWPAAGTILNVLTAHGISWVNYQGSARSLAIFVPRIFGKYGLIFGRSALRVLSAFNPFRASSIQDQLAFTADVYPLGLPNAVRHVRKIEQFRSDAAAGTLPSVSIVDPDFAANSGRPPQDVGQAESFVADVVNACMNGPGWEGTLLLWLQDNHGGYYDHVPPPAAVAPDDVPVVEGFRFRFPLVRRMLHRLTLTPYARQVALVDSGRIAYDRYGFRVPAVIVSPYARPDFVLSEVLDHTSVLKLIEEKWNLPPLTRRDAAATSPLGALDLGAEPAFRTPPTLAPPRNQLAAPGKLPPVVDAAAAFRIETTRDFPVRIVTLMAVWAATLLAFSWSLPWLQVIILVYGIYLTVKGMRRTEFWKMWVFWLPQRRRTRQVAAYNAIFAFITLAAFSALLSSVLYLYVPVQIAAHRSGGNILWLYTGTYVWNLAEAVPALEIPTTLHWASPMEASGLWGELLLLVFRLLVLTPVLALIVESIRGDNSEAKAKLEDPPSGP